MAPLIISVSGLRGEVGVTLDADVVKRYIFAYTELLNRNLWGGPVILGYDGRESGRAILAAVRDALTACGRDVLVAGVTATPTLGVLVKTHRAGGGVQVTASHNPHPWNGLKLFSPEGRVIPKTPGQEVKTRYETLAAEGFSLSETSAAAAGRKEGGYAEIADTVSDHLERILETVNTKCIRQCKFRVLLDANHGSGSVFGRVLLEKLGCEVIFASKNESPDGNFVHTPEPSEENLAGVCPKVREIGANVGFVQDPDADRLAIIDAAGRYIGEEYTVALCAEHILSQQKTAGKSQDVVITNCATSLMTRDVARRYGADFFFSAVGEANVVDLLLEKGAIFAGEGNGGPIDPRVGYVRDSFVGMAQVLDMMAQRGQTVAALAAELPRYEIVKKKLALTPAELPGLYARFLAKYPDAEVSRADGLRLGWEDGWVLVRGSNTEPVVRIMAEAKTREEAESRCRVDGD